MCSITIILLYTWPSGRFEETLLLLYPTNQVMNIFYEHNTYNINELLCNLFIVKKYEAFVP